MNKELIRTELENFIERKGSQRKAAHILGINPRYINHIINGTDLASINDEIWRKIANQLLSQGHEWKMVKTSVTEDIWRSLEYSRKYSLVNSFVGDAGTGKTASIRAYEKEHPNVFHIICKDYWSKKAFALHILKQTGINYTGSNITELMDELEEYFLRIEKPLIILDEADKLSYPLFYFFISFYNGLEKKCGLVLTATTYLEKFILRGVRLQKMGFEEIFSRICQKIAHLPAVSDQDIRMICKANGVLKESQITEVIKESKGDIRRVERSIWIIHQEELAGLVL